MSGTSKLTRPWCSYHRKCPHQSFKWYYGRGMRSTETPVRTCVWPGPCNMQCWSPKEALDRRRFLERPARVKGRARRNNI